MIEGHSSTNPRKERVDLEVDICYAVRLDWPAVRRVIFLDETRSRTALEPDGETGALFVDFVALGQLQTEIAIENDSEVAPGLALMKYEADGKMNKLFVDSAALERFRAENAVECGSEIAPGLALVKYESAEETDTFFVNSAALGQLQTEIANENDSEIASGLALVKYEADGKINNLFVDSAALERFRAETAVESGSKIAPGLALVKCESAEETDTFFVNSAALRRFLTETAAKSCSEIAVSLTRLEYECYLGTEAYDCAIKKLLCLWRLRVDTQKRLEIIGAFPDYHSGEHFLGVRLAPTRYFPALDCGGAEIDLQQPVTALSAEDQELVAKAQRFFGLADTPRLCVLTRGRYE